MPRLPFPPEPRALQTADRCTHTDARRKSQPGEVFNVSRFHDPADSIAACNRRFR